MKTQLAAMLAAMLRRPRLRAIGIVLILFAGCGLVDRIFVSPLKVSGELCGWDESLAKVEAPLIAAQMPRFAITDEDGNAVSGAGKAAELWKFAKVANAGHHIPTWKQESGDCVSMGASNAQVYRQAFQIASEGRLEDLKILFPPYTYGGSRVIIGHGQLGRSPGSVGAWAAQFAQSHGVYTLEQATKDGYRYSGQLADQWGQSGPPPKTLQFGRKFRIRSVAPVKSWQDVRDALVHGYPVTVASNIGFKGGSYKSPDNKLFLREGGSWAHQMCFIGVEDRPGYTKGAYIINSWGEDAHPAPLNGEPPGGFWVTDASVQKMVKQSDSWAYSDFDGFPAETADWNMLKIRAKETAIISSELIAAAESKPPPKPFHLEVRQMWSPTLLAVLFLIGCGVLAATVKWSYRTKISLLLIFGFSAIAYACAAPVNTQASPASMQRRANRMHNHKQSQYMYMDASTTKPKVIPEVELLDSPPEELLLASNEAVPLAVWNALETRQAKQVSQNSQPPPAAWNAVGSRQGSYQGPKVRSYADCYKSEKDFFLVVGLKALASKLPQPVAYEKELDGLKPGVYHVFDVPGKGLCLRQKS